MPATTINDKPEPGPELTQDTKQRANPRRLKTGQSGGRQRTRLTRYISDGGTGNGDGQLSLARAGAADQNHVALTIAKASLVPELIGAGDAARGYIDDVR